MRTFILVVLFLAAAIFYASQRYEIKTGHMADGKYTMVLVNKTTGEIKKLIGN